MKILIDSSHFRTKYRATCDKCGLDRGYLDKRNALKPHCIKCCEKIKPDTIAKMSMAKKGKTPWNKGLKEVRASVLRKLSSAKVGKKATNAGTKMTYEQKIKLSCINRNIPLSEFDDFTTKESKRERNKFKDLKLSLQCFEQSDFKCDSCGIDKTLLHAHHKASWKHYPHLRFELSNLASLCFSCHREFHSIYGNGNALPNTPEQVQDFIFKKNSKPKHKKNLYVIAGAPGSGKSWVCNQLTSKFNYVSYDKIDHKSFRSIAYNSPNDNILYDPTTNVSSLIKINSDIFNIKLIVILEDEAVVAARLNGRGGTLTASCKRRIRRMKTLAKSAVFSGTSSECLNYLLSV